MLHLNDALAIINDRQSAFSISFISCDEKKKSGGELIAIDKAVSCGLPFESKHRIGIRNSENSYHPMAVHQKLITRVNGQKVFY